MYTLKCPYKPLIDIHAHNPHIAGLECLNKYYTHKYTHTPTRTHPYTHTHTYSIYIYINVIQL